MGGTLIIAIIFIVVTFMYFKLNPDLEKTVKNNASVGSEFKEPGSEVHEPGKNFYIDEIKLDTYQYVGDETYFWEDKILKCSNAEGRLREFKSIVAKQSEYFQWLVSGDGRKVAWTEEISNKDDILEIALYVADLDGKNKLKVVEKGYLEIVRLENFRNSEALYYGKCAPEQYLKDLYKLNTQTGEVELILGREFDQNNYGDYITAVSSKAEYVAYFQGLFLIVREIATGQETKISLPTSCERSFLGFGAFSPNNQEFVFILANDEGIFEYVVVDLEIKNVKTYQDFKETPAWYWQDIVESEQNL